MQTMMEYRTLGSSGVSVSTLALGTMTFGTETGEDASHAQLDRFVEAGGNLVDTADVYSHGRSEQIIGRWLTKQPPEIRDQVVLATKGRFATGVGSQRGRTLSTSPRPGARRQSGAVGGRHDRPVPRARLGPLHPDRGDPDVPRHRGARRQDPLPRPVQLHRLADPESGGRSRRPRSARPVTLQPQYNLLAREVEWEIVPACRAEGLGLLPWSPLGGGWLTGKYHRNERPTGSTRLGENPNRGVEAYDRRGTTSERGTCSEPWRTSPAAGSCRWLRWRSPGWPTDPPSAR